MYLKFRASQFAACSQGRRHVPGYGLTPSTCSYEHTVVSITPQALQHLLDELEASRSSRKRAWEILQEIRWVLKDIAGKELPPPARKTIDLEGRLVKDAVRKTLKDRHKALADLVNVIRKYRKFSEQPLTLRGSDYAHAAQELNQAIDRAEELLQSR